MNAPFRVAQASTVGQGAQPTIIRLTKPADGQSVVVKMDGSVRLDLSALANEPMTLVRDKDGLRLHLVFQNNSEIIIDPFFEIVSANGKTQLQRFTVTVEKPASGENI